MKLFLLAASLRKDSVNKKLIQLVARLLPATCTIDLADFSEFDVPLYNADIQTAHGIPPNAQNFIQRMQQAQGTIISTPEYNFSTPGTLKNLIDWISRATPMPWRNQKISLMSASPSLVGGNRGLWHTRVPLESCGALVHPDMFSLANAYQVFDAQGNLSDAGLQQRLQENLLAFVQFLEKF